MYASLLPCRLEVIIEKFYCHLFEVLNEASFNIFLQVLVFVLCGEVLFLFDREIKELSGNIVHVESRII